MHRQNKEKVFSCIGVKLNGVTPVDFLTLPLHDFSQVKWKGGKYIFSSLRGFPHTFRTYRTKKVKISPLQRFAFRKKKEEKQKERITKSAWSNTLKTFPLAKVQRISR